ncbi:unnamed protein product, partial [marine sediment metagenome]
DIRLTEKGNCATFMSEIWKGPSIASQNIS